MEPAATSPIEPDATRRSQLVSPRRQVLLWICLAAWLISFFLPAAQMPTWGGQQTATGWQAAETAIVLFFVPVKGIWFFFVPHVWSVFLNVFMLMAPFKLRGLKQGKGRGFTILFVVATAVPVGLAFLPHRANFAGISLLLSGFYLWAFSLMAAAAWFAWAVWGTWVALLPDAILAAALLYHPSYRHHQRFRQIIEATSTALDAVSAAAPNVTAPYEEPTAYGDIEQLPRSPARAELMLATVYTKAALTCRGYARIAAPGTFKVGDSYLRGTFPGLQVYPHDWGRADQSEVAPGAKPNSCFVGYGRPETTGWVSGPDLEADALRRAHAHLANAETLMRWKAGTPAEPMPLSEVERYQFDLNRK